MAAHEIHQFKQLRYYKLIQRMRKENILVMQLHGELKKNKDKLFYRSEAIEK